MKRLLLLFLICAGMATIRAQDTLKYHYALLSIDRYNNIASVDYNNGFSEDLWKKLSFSQKNSHSAIIFRCFEYLNDSGYELVSSNRYTGVILPENTIEYLFKRKKK